MADPKPRERILAAATRLFYEEGILATGVDRVVAEAEVAPMTVYRQFGGKDELVAAALQQWSAHWLDRLNDNIDRSGDDPEARYMALWDTLEEGLATKDSHGSFVANAATELRGRPDHPAQKVIDAHQRATRQLLEDLAERAGAGDPASLAEQLVLLVNGAIATVDCRSTVITAARALATTALTSNSACRSPALCTQNEEQT